VKLHYDRETEDFRTELRDWIEANRPSAEEMRRDPSRSSADLRPWARAWQRRLFDAGWLVPGWPPELGGRNATPVQQLVFAEEFARTAVRRSYNPQGLSIITPSIVDYGNDAQKERFVGPSLRGEIAWCLGMSEPGAGSDLAGLSTRAELHGDRFVVNGQKVWTSGAQHADFCFCFVRTNPTAPKHKGISVLIIDMKSPGIGVRPLPELTDQTHADFNEVFFEDVEVPRENLVGPIDEGWAITAGSLAHERGMLWTEMAARLDHAIEKLRELGERPGPGGRRLGDDARFRDQIAQLYVDTQALRFLGYQGFAKFARGQVSPEHSLLKLMGSELDQRMTLMASEWLGPAALDVTYEGNTFDFTADVPWVLQYLRSFSNTIAGGTSEIQRNIIAQRVLSLPRR
jgi:alkylation response protein AidB-like acyl-CoA dehydrogenase